MEPSDCPIHTAALLSRRRASVEPLLGRVQKRAATSECRTCLLCRKALECLTDPSADSWFELWHSSLRPYDALPHGWEEVPRPLMVHCPDCGVTVDTGLRIEPGPNAFAGPMSLRCPNCQKVVSFRARDTFN